MPVGKLEIAEASCVSFFPFASLLLRNARMSSQAGVIAYNAAAFVCALFVLEFGAEKFIDHTVILAKRLGIPQGLLALLTAGAEWEEVSPFNVPDSDSLLL